MKEITATQLKSNISEFFDALLSDGGVVITRHGKRFAVGLLDEARLGDNAARREAERKARLVYRAMPEALRREPGELAEAFASWVDSHKVGVGLTPQDLSRENIYEDR